MAQEHEVGARKDIAFEERVYVPAEHRTGLNFNDLNKDSPLAQSEKHLPPLWRDVMGWDVLDNGLVGYLLTVATCSLCHLADRCTLSKKSTTHTTTGVPTPVHLLGEPNTRQTHADRHRQMANDCK